MPTLVHFGMKYAMVQKYNEKHYIRVFFSNRHTFFAIITNVHLATLDKQNNSNLQKDTKIVYEIPGLKHKYLKY